MTKLINTLTANTQDLKNEFFERTIANATRLFNECEKMYNKSEQEKIAMFSNIQNYKIQNHYWKSIVWTGLDSLIQSELRNAENHYNSSIIKLANRLVKKGVTENFTIISGKVQQNFEMVITSENKTIRAYTIIASGEIQRPHYRYLVK